MRTIGELKVPSGVTGIGDRAFSGRTNLTSVSLPSGVTSIGNSAFDGCTNLTSVKLPNSVTGIGSGAFSGCTSLTRAVLPAGITSLEGGVFYDCANLTSVSIPSGVTEIGGHALRGCKALTEIYIPASVAGIGYAAFYDTGLKDVYYGGTQEQWQAIACDQFNDSLTSAAIHYNSPMPAAGTGFTDVADGAWYAEPVRWAVEQEITNGTGPTTFSPGGECTNAQVLTFLYRAAGNPAAEASLPFPPENSWAADALAWAYGNGMIGADLDENRPCTRADAVQFIWQAMGRPAAVYDGRFVDVAASDSCAQAVAWAVDAAVTTGVSETAFSPGGTCTRGHIVTFLYRAYQ